jgi:hypothetical protein
MKMRDDTSHGSGKDLTEMANHPNQCLRPWRFHKLIDHAPFNATGHADNGSFHLSSETRGKKM